MSEVGWVGLGPPILPLREAPSLSSALLVVVVAVAVPFYRGRFAWGWPAHLRRQHSGPNAEVAGEQLLREASVSHWWLGPQYHGRRSKKKVLRVDAVVLADGLGWPDQCPETPCPEPAQQEQGAETS